ncbi:MAG: HAD-IIIA family hydrolase [Ginsengibacter sp.]
MTELKKIDKNWTLFLDRDGVINDEKETDYIKTWEEFRFLPGAKEAIKNFTEKFGNIVIITNQRGVSKGITKLEDLEVMHKNMIAEIVATGGKITKLYYCIDMDDASPNRKPNTGMGLQAKKEFPEIDFSKTVMVGNTISDMEFGRNLGIPINIFLPSAKPSLGLKQSLADHIFPDLLSFSKVL